MNNIFKALGSIHPLKIGISYLVLILISAFLLYLCPEFKLSSSTVDHPNSFSSSIYFTLVTITTLGYGDILPDNEITRILVVILSFGGVALTGLFLNSLAHTISKITQSEDEKKFNEQISNEKKSKFIDASPILTQKIDNYMLMAFGLITPIAKIHNGLNYEKLKSLDFDINDFVDLFGVSLIPNADRTQSTYELYLKSFDNLISALNDFILQGYFAYDIKLMKKIIKAIVDSNALDYRSTILLIYKKSSDEQRPAWVVFIQQQLQNAPKDKQVTEGYDILNEYIFLREQVKIMVKLIEEINLSLNDLNSNN